jgi:hypothetical protein
LKPKKQNEITVRSGAAEEKMARLTGELPVTFVRSRESEEEIRKRLGTIGYET